MVVIVVVIFYPITQPAAAATPTPTEQEQKIAAFLGNDPNKINNPIYRWVATEVIRTENTGNRALVIIVSDTSWSALIQDTDITQRTIDNSWSKSIDFKCDSNNVFFIVTVSKTTDVGDLSVLVAKGGKVIRQADTPAAFGIVSVSGYC